MNVLTGVSIAATGKDIGDHAVSLVADQDCRILEGIVRPGRKICEDYGAPATADDFHGLSTVAQWIEPSTPPPRMARGIYEYKWPVAEAVAQQPPVAAPAVIPAAFVVDPPTAPAIEAQAEPAPQPEPKPAVTPAPRIAERHATSVPAPQRRDVRWVDKDLLQIGSGGDPAETARELRQAIAAWRQSEAAGAESRQ